MTDNTTPKEVTQAAMTEAGDLLPCPFCGMQPTRVSLVGYESKPPSLQCTEPLYTVDHRCWVGGNTEAEAITAWNTRAPITPSVDKHDERFDIAVAAYKQGAMDVHENWQEDRDPDFTEAAHDYARTTLSQRGMMGNHESCVEWGDNFCRHGHPCGAEALEAASSTPLVAPSDRSQRAVVEAMKGIIAAWESLPGPRHYSVREMQEWISGPMTESINNARAALAALQPPAADTRTEDGLAYREAVSLATILWRKHFAKDAPNWKPLDTTAGVISQIDNMTAVMARTTGQPAIAAADNATRTEDGLADAVEGAIKNHRAFIRQKPEMVRECLDSLLGTLEISLDYLRTTGQPAIAAAKPVGEADVEGCTCLEIHGENPKCPKHGTGTQWAAGNPE